MAKPKTVWKGNFEFGRLLIPVKLVVAARSVKIPLKRVNADTGAQVKNRAVDSGTGGAVKSTLKSAKTLEGQTVHLTDAEVDALVPEEEQKRIEVAEFVRLSHVDPIYFDTSYFVLPDEAEPVLAYTIMSAALCRTKCAAVGKMSLAKRQHLVLIKPSDRGLTLHTLFYHNEIRPEGFHVGGIVPNAELKLAASYIRARREPFDPSKYQNEFNVALRELIESKTESREADITGALTGSLKDARKARKASP